MPPNAYPSSGGSQLRTGPRPPAPADLLAALEHGDAIAVRCVVVVAHPDDETIGLGSRLALMRELDLIQVTDGAPRDMADARRAGFNDPQGYRAARESEVQAALRALCARPRRRELGVRDQDAVHRLPDIVAALVPRLARAAAVATHAYEGGHPDHDACALAVQLACGRLQAAGRAAPVRLEFASYHLADGRQVSGDFWPDADHAAVSAEMTPAQLQAKREAFAAFRSQAEVMAWFSPETERFRLAPDYDVSQPPPPGEALYDRFGWGFTSADWRRDANRAMAATRVGR